MKCLLKDCENAAVNGFPCCSSLHGLMYVKARDVLKDLSYANTQDGLNQWNWYFEHLPTVADYEYYNY